MTDDNGNVFLQTASAATVTTTNLSGHPAAYTWRRYESVLAWLRHAAAFHDLPPRVQGPTAVVCLCPKTRSTWLTATSSSKKTSWHSALASN